MKLENFRPSNIIIIKKKKKKKNNINEKMRILSLLSVRFYYSMNSESRCFLFGLISNRFSDFHSDLCSLVPKVTSIDLFYYTVTGIIKKWNAALCFTTAQIISLFLLRLLDPFRLYWKRNSVEAGASGSYAALQIPLLHIKRCGQTTSLICTLICVL